MVKPYWKSASHIIIFSLMILAHVFLFASFTLDMIAFMKDPASTDPEAPARITTLIVVIAVFASFIIDIVFFSDLFRYIRLKRRTSNNIKSNVEIVAEDAGKEEANKEAKKMLKFSEVIADVNEVSLSNGAEFEFPQESMRRPSLKATLMTTFYAAGLPLLAIFGLFFVAIFLFFIAIDPSHVLEGLRNAATISVLVIVLFIVALAIIIIVQKIKVKKKAPKEIGLRIYPEYVEQYVVANKEARMETRFKVRYDNMKRTKTKNFYLIKGKVNNQTAVITIYKQEVHNEVIDLIEGRYLKAKEAKKAKKEN